jgi:hypothetical protein
VLSACHISFWGVCNTDIEDFYTTSLYLLAREQIKSDVCASEGSKDIDFVLVGCDVIYFCKWLPTFRMKGYSRSAV